MSSDEEDPFYYDIDNQKVFSKIDYIANLLYKPNDDEKHSFITEMEEQFRFQGPENMFGLLNELERTHNEKNNDYSDDFEKDSDDNIEDSNNNIEDSDDNIDDSDDNIDDSDDNVEDSDDNIEDSDDNIKDKSDKKSDENIKESEDNKSTELLRTNYSISINDFNNDILKKILFNDCIKLKDFQQFMKINKYYYDFCKTIYKEKVKLWEELEMEDSYKKGKEIELSFKKNPCDCKYLSELIKICENGDFGDMLFLDSYRDSGTIIIGKNQELVHNPDYSGSGYLSIPYKITRFFRDATYKYKSIEYNSIDLRYDDKWVIDNLNTENFSIPDNWRIRLWNIYNTIEIFFTNKINHMFNIENINAEKINNWYLSSSKPKIKIEVYYSIEGEKYVEFKKKYTTTDKYSWMSSKPLIPDSWSIEGGQSGGGGNSHDSTSFYLGPKEEKDIVIKSIKTFYEGFNFNIKEILI